MSKGDQFTIAFLLIANLWLIAATLTTDTRSKSICALVGGGWIIGYIIGLLLPVIT